MTHNDLDLLQGVWEQTGLEADGIVNPPDQHGAPGAVTIIRGNHFDVRTPDGTQLLEGTFVLDTTVEPRAIYWTDAIGDDAGKVLPASYVLQGESFVFIAADEGRPRPVTFTTSPGLTMRSFRRRA